MLLTRKASAAVAPTRLSKGVASVLAKTMDRRTFLKRSGVTMGAGAAALTAASQLPFSVMGALPCGHGEPNSTVGAQGSTHWQLLH